MKEVIETKKTFDSVTGEVTEDIQSVSKTKARDPRPWVKLYLDAWVTIKGFKGVSKQTVDVLYLVLTLLPGAYAISKDKPVITPAPYNKEQWASQLGTSVAVVNKHIQKLASVGVLQRVSRGAYIVNPQLIGYGSDVNIERLKRVSGSFELTAEGATITPTLESDPEPSLVVNEE